jgi:KUP system potassium uptake protein
MHTTWRWPLWVVAPVAGLFLIVDGAFFIANLAKIADGGWIPLSLGFAIFGVMITWRTGVKAMRDKLSSLSEPTDTFLADLRTNKVARVPGAAVYLTRGGDRIPQYVKEFVHNMGSMHSTVIILNVLFEEQPRILDERYKVDPIVDGLTHVTLRFGFVEVPDIPFALRDLDACGDRKARENAVFFGTRDVVMADKHGLLTRWRVGLFSFLHKNTVRLIDRFNLPPERTVEISRLVKL